MDGEMLDLSKGALFQRVESKYLLSPLEVDAIRDFIAPYVSLDPHTPTGQCSYRIASLYLDSPDMRLLGSSERGEKNRAKLRLRHYGDRPESPVFFEIKRRMNQVIRKQRASVRRECVAAVLDWLPCTAGMLSGDDASKELFALHAFRDMSASICATPRCMVYYEREAYLSDFEEPVRVSIDRNLACLPATQYSDALWSPAHAAYDVRAFEAVLEVKFTNQFPRWVDRLIHRFELKRISMAKYVTCVHALRRRGVFVEGYPIELSA